MRGLLLCQLGVILPGMKKLRCIGDSNFAKFKQFDFDSVWTLCICLQFGLARLSQLFEPQALDQTLTISEVLE